MGRPVARLARAPPQAPSSQSESLIDRAVASTMTLNLKKIPALLPRRSCPCYAPLTEQSCVCLLIPSLNPSISHSDNPTKLGGALKTSDPTSLRRWHGRLARESPWPRWPCHDAGVVDGLPVGCASWSGSWPYNNSIIPEDGSVNKNIILHSGQTIQSVQTVQSTQTIQTI